MFAVRKQRSRKPLLNNIVVVKSKEPGAATLTGDPSLNATFERGNLAQRNQ